MLLRLAVGLIFIVVPVLELMVLIKIGQHIGVLPTVALVLGTALTGAFIISRQSMAVITRALEAVSEGRPPVAPVLDGLFLIAAGALLLTPGLLTDMVALALLVPPLRRAIARTAMRWVLRRADVTVHAYGREDGGPSRAGPSSPNGGLGDGPIIEGEFERVDERPVRPGNSRPPASRL